MFFGTHRRLSAGSWWRLLLPVIVVASVLLAGTPSARAAEFNPNLVVSDDTMRAYDSMTAADVQAFLELKGGALKDMSFPRHDGGAAAPASTIIYEAGRAWNISPKVLVVMLQKEQSLITTTTPTQRALDRAVGAGCPNGYTNRYPGFGNQIWNGARLLNAYGETSVPVAQWYLGIRTWDIYQNPKVPVYPANIATYKLYTYNPSIGAKAPYGDLSAQISKLSGNANFWRIYWNWFGDPFANPSVTPVYRFVARKTGATLYTSSYAQRYRLIKRSTKTYAYKGVAFSVTTSPTTETAPLYSFTDKKSGAMRYTTSESQKRGWQSQSRKLRYNGIAFMTSTSATGTVPVYRFLDKKSKSPVFVTSESQRATFLQRKYRARYRYKGIAFLIKP